MNAINIFKMPYLCAERASYALWSTPSLSELNLSLPPFILYFSRAGLPVWMLFLSEELSPYICRPVCTQSSMAEYIFI